MGHTLVPYDRPCKWADLVTKISEKCGRHSMTGPCFAGKEQEWGCFGETPTYLPLLLFLRRQPGLQALHQLRVVRPELAAEFLVLDGK